MRNRLVVLVDNHAAQSPIQRVERTQPGNGHNYQSQPKDAHRASFPTLILPLQVPVKLSNIER